VLTEKLNIVNAPVIMRSRGITVTVATTSEVRGYTELVTITVLTDRGSYQVAGTVFPQPDCRIAAIDEYRTEAPLEGRMLLISNYDPLELIGFIGMTLRSHQVNIADMHLSRIRSKATAICLVTVDSLWCLPLQSRPCAVSRTSSGWPSSRCEKQKRGLHPSLPSPAFPLDRISEI
jgi:D-3-phosphoglycerate dehydrogenase